MSTPRGTLTTCQHSALGELHRFGELRAPDRTHPLVDRGTVYGYSRVTLRALVTAGYARWSSRVRVAIVPAGACPFPVGCGCGNECRCDPDGACICDDPDNPDGWDA